MNKREKICKENLKIDGKNKSIKSSSIQAL
jgi:hypothetical protein